MFGSVFPDGSLTASPSAFFTALGLALVCGFGYALLACRAARTAVSRSFFTAVGLLPGAVAAVIALVNGSVGTGLAVAGAFSLVRFRSAPGSAREIAVIFIAMAGGLCFGVGYAGYGFALLAVFGLLLFAADRVPGPDRRPPARERVLRIVVPEDLEYGSVFDDLFDKYTLSRERTQVKTMNMGSTFRLCYRLTLKDPAMEKEFIDALRCRNGNLEISLNSAESSDSDL